MEKLIGIIGGRQENTSKEACILAEAVGVEIAKRGFGLICGGGDGTMEAACRGCQQAKGTTIGVLKWNHSADANSFIDFAIPTSMDLARNNIIVWAASGVIAFEGGYGTASEMSLALDIEKPLMVVGDNFLLQDKAFKNIDHCIRMAGNDVKQVGEILDNLFNMIESHDPLKFAR